MVQLGGGVTLTVPTRRAGENGFSANLEGSGSPLPWFLLPPGQVLALPCLNPLSAYPLSVPGDWTDSRCSETAVEQLGPHLG